MGRFNLRRSVYAITNFGDSMIQCGEKDVLAQRVDFVVDHGDDAPPYNCQSQAGSEDSEALTVVFFFIKRGNKQNYLLYASSIERERERKF